MTLLFADGCDLYATVTDAQQAGWTTGSGTSINTTGGRFGGGAFAGNQDDQGFTISIPQITSGGTLIAQLAYRAISTTILSDDVFVGFLESGTRCASVRTLTTGGVRVLDVGTNALIHTSNLLLMDDWNYIEFKAVIHDTTGQLIVKINGDEIANETGLDTIVTTGPNEVRFSGDNLNWLIDDIIVMDGTGDTMNDFIGDVRITTLLPDADVLEEWTQSESGPTYELLDDALGSATDDTTYIESSTNTDETRCGFESLPANTDVVHAVAGVYASRMTDAGPRTIRGLVNSNSVEQVGASHSQTTGYETVRDFYGDDPGTGSPQTAWTEAAVNDIEMGVEVVS